MQNFIFRTTFPASCPSSPPLCVRCSHTEVISPLPQASLPWLMTVLFLETTSPLLPWLIPTPTSELSSGSRWAEAAFPSAPIGARAHLYHCSSPGYSKYLVGCLCPLLAMSLAKEGNVSCSFLLSVPAHGRDSNTCWMNEVLLMEWGDHCSHCSGWGLLVGWLRQTWG